jgi:hypothetical protein
MIRIQEVKIIYLFKNAIQNFYQNSVKNTAINLHNKLPERIRILNNF